MNAAAGLSDALHTYTQTILDSIIGLAPVAVVGLAVILVIYGLAFRR